jgi:type III pantothenate kinase
MFLAIDIGNTHTVAALYDHDAFKSVLRIENTAKDTVKDLSSMLSLFLHQSGADSDMIKGAGISSVVPELTGTYASISISLFGIDPLIIGPELELGISIHYKDPYSLGSDRICSAVAGYDKYGGPLIIIDFGTATTYNVIASNGDFAGGVIAPGIKTSASGLHNRTARLPEIELNLPAEIICTDTVSGMQAGVLWGAVDSVLGMVNRLQNEIERREKKKAVVIATGGFSGFAAQHLDIIRHTDPYLVPDGIRLICMRTGNYRPKPSA